MSKNFLPSGDQAAASILAKTGLASPWWPDQVIGIAPGLIAAGYEVLLAWRRDCSVEYLHHKRQDVNQLATAESGTVEQLGLPI